MYFHPYVTQTQATIPDGVKPNLKNEKYKAIRKQSQSG